MKAKFLFALLTALALAGSAAGQTKPRAYTIVAAESSFWVFVAKAGLLSGLAHDHEIGIKSFSGRVVIPALGAGEGSLQLEIDARSLAVLDKKPSEEDRAKIAGSMHNEVLASAQYPKITFKSVSVSDLKPTGATGASLILNGDLTLHGVTKRIAIPVALTLVDQQLRATGNYTLKQTDYGIKPYSAAGGTVKVKDEVVIHFNLVAKAQ